MAFESFKKINFLNRTASIGTSHKELYKKIAKIFFSIIGLLHIVSNNYN